MSPRSAGTEPWTKERHRAHMREYMRRYTAEHAEEIKAKAKLRREEQTPEDVARKREYDTQWRAENRETLREKARRSREQAKTERRENVRLGTWQPCEEPPPLGSLVRIRSTVGIAIPGDGRTGHVIAHENRSSIVRLDKCVVVDGEVWTEIGCPPNELLRRA